MENSKGKGMEKIDGQLFNSPLSDDQLEEVAGGGGRFTSVETAPGLPATSDYICDAAGIE